MPHAYTEDQLVEQPAIGLFAELGWQTVSALEEIFGATGTLSRETKGEVVLVARLRSALDRLNPALPPEAITAAVSWISPFSLASELGRFSASPAQMTGHGSGHGRRKNSDGIALSGSFVTVKTESRADIYADI